MHEPQRLVMEFHLKHGHPLPQHPVQMSPQSIMLRKRLMEEELGELVEAMWAGDMVKVADGLADLLVVTYGTAIAAGIDMEPIFREVHFSNMTKDVGPQDSGGKILKGPSFKQPELGPILSEQSADLTVYSKYIRGLLMLRVVRPPASLPIYTRTAPEAGV
jgi:predicted HAD superfamily Cof-like phosphohydrolase